MKGMNVMTGVLILLVISMTVFAWISTQQTVGEGTTEDLERSALIAEADRRLQKNQLYIQSMFSMATQRGSAFAANNSGRAGKNMEQSYWMCKGSIQTPEIGEAQYAISNNTEEITSDRMSEARGLRRNWLHEVGEISCTETGYNEPLESSENDHFDSSIKIEEIKTQERDGRAVRLEKPYEFKEQVNYNRYWYLYSKIKKWTEQEGESITQQISENLSSVESQYAEAERTCITNVSLLSRTPDQICKGPPVEDYPPSGTYPEPYVCQEPVNDADDGNTDAEEAVANAIEGKVEKLENNYFDGEVSCHAGFNENSQGFSYPGIKAKVNPRTQPVETSEECATGANDVEGTVYRCTTSWTHSFDIWADFEVTCNDEKFSNVPKESGLGQMTWRINMSLTSSGQGNTESTSCTPGGSVPPLNLKSCTAAQKTGECSTVPDVTGDLE